MLKNLRGILGFSKREMNGVLLLIPLIIFIMLLPSFYAYFYRPDYDEASDQALLDSLVSLLPEAKGSVEISFDPFVFDPNVLSKDSLELLGIPSFLVNRMVNYRNAGGRFKAAEDLQKIYDFPDSLFIQLRPYVAIASPLEDKPVFRTSKENYATTPSRKVVKESIKTADPIRKPLMIDINGADTSELKLLYGIGTTYSNRIVKYRELLGGYITVDQLTEVYGITDSLYQQIVPFVTVADSSIRKLAINLASFKEVNAHPYISYEQTKDIFNQKSKVGKYQGAADLVKLRSFDSLQVEKLIPYIDFK